IVKPGYQPVIKEYSKDLKWDKEQRISLTTRQVDLTAEPFDAEILVDGRVIGTKAIYLYVQKDRFLTVEVKKPGYVTSTKVFYNQADKEAPPMKDHFVLKDRQVRVEVSPADAAVAANGMTMGKGNQDIKIPYGDCVTVTVNKD